MTASTDRIRALAEPALSAAGLELWDVETGPDLLRILVDRPGGVDLDAVTQATRIVSDLLDEHDDLTPGATYQLEVSSPGLERTLRTPDQYRRYVGTTVTVKTTTAVAGERRHRGVLVEAGDEAIGLLPDDAPAGSTREIPYTAIDRARTVVDWAPAPKPGSRPKAGRTRTDPAGRTTAGAPTADAAAAPARDTKDRSR